MEQWTEEDAKRVQEALKSRAKDGRIACQQAFKLADELGVPPFRIGEAANVVKVKIKGCQLGCFK